MFQSHCKLHLFLIPQARSSVSDREARCVSLDKDITHLGVIFEGQSLHFLHYQILLHHDELRSWKVQSKQTFRRMAYGVSRAAA